MLAASPSSAGPTPVLSARSSHLVSITLPSHGWSFSVARKAWIWGENVQGAKFPLIPWDNHGYVVLTVVHLTASRLGSLSSVWEYHSKGAIRDQGFMEPASASAALERLGSPWQSTCFSPCSQQDTRVGQAWCTL